MNVRQKARELKIPEATLRWRIKHGWDEKDWEYRKPVIQKNLKRCTVCKVVKAQFLFYKRKGRNGYISRCKECAKKAP